MRNVKYDGKLWSHTNTRQAVFRQKRSRSGNIQNNTEDNSGHPRDSASVRGELSGFFLVEDTKNLKSYTFTKAKKHEICCKNNSLLIINKIHLC